MIRAALFDIDGTLADNRHRQTFLTCTPKDWDGFHGRMIHDLPRPAVVDLAKALAANQTAIVMLTGRPEAYRLQTKQWLELHSVPYAALFMRPDGDFRPADDMKAAIYEERIRPFFDVRLVVEDSDDVVEMWREIGLECWQVARGVG